MSAEIAKSFRKTPSSAHFSGQNLDGLYIAPDGSRLKLTGSSYSLQKNDVVETGAFAVFMLEGRTVLDMRAVSEGAQPSSRRTTWELALSTRNDDGGKSIVVMKLTPARVGIDGITLTETAALSMEKSAE
ncbi:MAG: hypothetical protein E4H20_06150 [Spirochaetales bacterium]|nr:MAG: hypothetical protein E4H20_06150 [Spirochaetales bacterium]